jgi:hypothetical protein
MYLAEAEEAATMVVWATTGGVLAQKSDTKTGAVDNRSLSILISLQARNGSGNYNAKCSE